MTESRRIFLSLLARLAATTVVSHALTGCTDATDSARTASDVDQGGTATEPGISADFLHGVASGDPQRDSVILWTRVTPQQAEGSAIVHWRWHAMPHSPTSRTVAQRR